MSRNQVQFKVVEHYKSKDNEKLSKAIEKVLKRWYNNIHTVDTVTNDTKKDEYHG